MFIATISNRAMFDLLNASERTETLERELRFSEGESKFVVSDKVIIAENGYQTKTYTAEPSFRGTLEKLQRQETYEEVKKDIAALLKLEEDEITGFGEFLEVTFHRKKVEVYDGTTTINVVARQGSARKWRTVMELKEKIRDLLPTRVPIDFHSITFCAGNVVLSQYLVEGKKLNKREVVKYFRFSDYTVRDGE